MSNFTLSLYNTPPSPPPYKTITPHATDMPSSYTSVLPHPNTASTFTPTDYSITTTPNDTIHQTLPAPSHSRTGIEPLRHRETHRLRPPTYPVTNPNQYYLGQDLITFALETMHRLSPFSTNRHYLPLTFTQSLYANSTRDTFFYNRHLTHTTGPSLNSEFLLIPILITPLH